MAQTCCPRLQVWDGGSETVRRGKLRTSGGGVTSSEIATVDIQLLQSSKLKPHLNWFERLHGQHHGL